jgi:hypothetical protein
LQQNGNGSARFQSLVLGTGDAYSLYNINGGQAWSVGLDNSDSDKFKISGASELGTSDYLTITTAGNLGIGTTSPSALLTIGNRAGNATFGGDVLINQANNTLNSIGGLEFKPDGANNGYGYKLQSLFDGSSSYDFTIQSRSNSATWTERIRLKNSGNLLVGTTTDAGFKLDVNGTARIGGSSASAQLYLKGGVGNGQYLYFDDGGSNLWTIVGASIFAIDSSSTRIFRANANAQVTINGSSVNATAQLQVDSTTRGFLPPRMTNAQRTAISSPAVGLLVYQTDATEGTYEYISSGWRIINGGGGGGSVDELQVALISQVFG